MGRRDAALLAILLAVGALLFLILRINRAEGVLSFLVMFLLKKTGRFHMITVSIAGGVFHNVGRVIVAMLVLGSGYVAYYLPVLWVGGITAGAVIGLISAQIVKRLPSLRQG